MRWSLLAAGVCALGGCSRTLFKVSADDKSGIPFLSFESLDVTTLMYEQVWVEVTLAADQVPMGTKPEDFAKAKFTTTRTFFHTDAAQVAEALKAFNGKGEVELAYSAALDYLGASLSVHGFTNIEPSEVRWTDTKEWKSPKIRLASLSHARAQVPSSKTMYLNGETPFGGSSSGTVQLAANGTLAQAQAQTENKLANDAITAVGGIITAGVTGLYGVTAAKAAAARPLVIAPEPGKPGGPQYIAARISVTPVKRVYKIVLERSSELTNAKCPLDLTTRLAENAPMSVDDLTCRGSFSVALVRGGQENADGDDSKAIHVKGSVMLPSADGGK